MCSVCSSVPPPVSPIHSFLSVLFFKPVTWPFPPSCSLSVIPARSHKVAVLLLSAGSSSLYIQRKVWFKSAVIQAVMLHTVLYTTGGTLGRRQQHVPMEGLQGLSHPAASLTLWLANAIFFCLHISHLQCLLIGHAQGQMPHPWRYSRSGSLCATWLSCGYPDHCKAVGLDDL